MEVEKSGAQGVGVVKSEHWRRGPRQCWNLVRRVRTWRRVRGLQEEVGQHRKASGRGGGGGGGVDVGVGVSRRGQA